MLRSISNNSTKIKNIHLKEFLKKSLKITSITLGVSVLAFGGYSLSRLTFFILYYKLYLIYNSTY